MRPVVFLHIFKTGGMSFGQIVRRQFPRGAVVKIDAATVDEFEDKWRELPEALRARVRCLEGHVPFGVDRVLAEPAVYATFLRDPVERFTSAYHFLLRRPDIAVHRTLVQKRMSLEDFAAGPEGDDQHDLQTRMIAGDGPAADLLPRAQRNIEGRFALVGLVERFDESTLLARRLLGWRNVLYMKTNQNKRNPGSESISPRARALIEERSARDLELYRWARARFAALLEQHPISARELLAFTTLNRGYGLARRALGLPGALIADVRASALRRAIARESR
jgi:hypothetical protein